MGDFWFLNSCEIIKSSIKAISEVKINKSWKIFLKLNLITWKYSKILVLMCSVWWPSKIMLAKITSNQTEKKTAQKNEKNSALVYKKSLFFAFLHDISALGIKGYLD